MHPETSRTSGQASSIHEAEWAAAMDSSDDVIYLLDLHRRLVRANTSFYRLTGTSPETAIGRHIAGIIHPMGEAAPCPVCQAQEDKRDAVIIMEADHPDNPAGRPLEIVVKVVRNNSGDPLSIFMSLHDLTNGRRLVEEKMILEEQLKQAQKLEAMGALAGGIAHDINNILAPILGYSELALTRLSPGDPLTGDLRQITKAARRAKDLTHQILAFSRRVPQEKKPFQPHLVVKEALKLLRASLPATIAILEEIPPECGTILADSTQFHQIIMNLCTNAYHAMRETGGVLGVSLAQVTIGEENRPAGSALAPGNYVAMEVSDTGCGMAQETLAHIFDPYFTTKIKGDGTGLGLSVVHGIVNSYAGHIAVHSEPGTGTSFRVYLPRIAETPFLAEAVCSETIPTGTEQLLVVDDEEAIATMLQLILESLGYQVTICSDSLAALARIEQDPMAFDLLITDMTMPKLTGFELAQKALAIRPDLPIILCTGFSELIDKEQAHSLGIRAYLMKPVSVRELGLAVRRVLDVKKEVS